MRWYLATLAQLANVSWVVISVTPPGKKILHTRLVTYLDIRFFKQIYIKNL